MTSDDFHTTPSPQSSQDSADGASAMMGAPLFNLGPGPVLEQQFQASTVASSPPPGSGDQIWIAGWTRSGRTTPRRHFVKSHFPPTSPSPISAMHGPPGGSLGLGWTMGFNELAQRAAAIQDPPATLPSPPMTPPSQNAEHIPVHVREQPPRPRSRAKKASAKGNSHPTGPGTGAGSTVQAAKRRLMLKELLPRLLVTPELDEEDLGRFGRLQTIALHIITHSCSYDQEDLGRFLAQRAPIDTLRDFSDTVLRTFDALAPTSMKIPNTKTIRVIDVASSTEEDIANYTPFDLCNAACSACLAWTGLHPERWMQQVRASMQQSGGGSSSEPPPLDLGGEVRLLRPDSPSDLLEGRTRTGLPVALHRVNGVPAGTDIAKRVRGALRTGQRLMHPVLLPLYGVVEEAGALFVVSPWLSCTAITEREMSAGDACRYLRQIARALKYMHVSKPPVVHGGVHPMNVLISELGEPLLSDFGLAAILEDLEVPDHPPPPTRYAAPELFRAGARRTVKSDVWAFGCLVYEVFTGEPPEGLPIRRAEGMVEELWTLVTRCCAYDPAARPAMGDVARRLGDIAATLS